MEGKGRIYNRILTVIMLVLSAGCSRQMERENKAVLTIRLKSSGMTSRSIMPDEDTINNLRIFVYNDTGKLEAISDGQEKVMSTRLLTGRSYCIVAAANIDQELKTETLEELMHSRYSMASPYDYEQGIAMSAVMENIYLEDDTSVEIRLERLMAKISIRIDRSGLKEGVEMTVQKIRIGNCPANAAIFQDSKITESKECFDIGFEREDTDVLNISGTDRMSGDLSLYLLENMQGRFSIDGPESETEKVFDETDVRRELCSYIEMEMEYHSDSLFCTDKPLVYRFYIGDGLNSLDVERNCHYHITVRPDNDGLCEDIWRVEKGGLHTYVQEIILSEERVLLDYMGKSEELEAAIFPPHAYNKRLIWESSDPDIASIDPSGKVTAASEGECLITCSSTDGSGVVTSCIIRNEFAPPRFSAYPEYKYINGNIGDTVRLWCDVFPPNTPFDIGLEYLEDDRNAGVYDYIIDEDGHGVTLILTGPGSGLVYMEAFEPVNDAALYFIEVNLPEDTLSEEDYFR